jgi:hypothetical protein
VVLVPTGTLEVKGGGGDLFLEAPAAALPTVGQRGGRDLLDLLKLVLAVWTDVLVDRH